MIDQSVIVSGNSILFRGNEFIVDEACQGLKMLAALLILLMIFIYRNVYGQRPNLKTAAFISGGIIYSVILWVFSNQLRIITLVYFGIPSESSVHYLIGIALFLCINVFPLMIVNELAVKSKTGHVPVVDDRKKHQKTNKFTMLFPVLCSGLLAVFCLFFKSGNVEQAIKFPDRIGVYKYQESVVTESFFGNDNQIVSYSDGNNRLILKNNLYPLRIIHHPKQCYTGAGFEFLEEQMIDTNRGRIMSAGLKLGGQTYKLLWWYQGLKKNKIITQDEFEWRKEQLLGDEKFIQASLLSYEYDENEISYITDMLDSINFLSENQ